jgi:hypothetical protein
MTWLVHYGLMGALAAHLTRAHARGHYVASNLTAKASRGRASRWEPHHGVGQRRVVQNWPVTRRNGCGRAELDGGVLQTWRKGANSWNGCGTEQLGHDTLL